MEKPEIVRDEHLEFLDRLRDSARTNMFGAGPYLVYAFGVSKKEAREILSYWMASFEDRHPLDEESDDGEDAGV